MLDFCFVGDNIKLDKVYVEKKGRYYQTVNFFMYICTGVVIQSSYHWKTQPEMATQIHQSPGRDGITCFKITK